MLVGCSWGRDGSRKSSSYIYLCKNASFTFSLHSVSNVELNLNSVIVLWSNQFKIPCTYCINVYESKKKHTSVCYLLFCLVIKLRVIQKLHLIRGELTNNHHVVLKSLIKVTFWLWIRKNHSFISVVVFTICTCWKYQ